MIRWLYIPLRIVKNCAVIVFSLTAVVWQIYRILAQYILLQKCLTAADWKQRRLDPDSNCISFLVIPQESYTGVSRPSKAK